jgi:hypothetical protein
MSYDKKKLTNILKDIIKFTTDEDKEKKLFGNSITLLGGGTKIKMTGKDGKSIVIDTVGEDSRTIYIYGEGMLLVDDFANECLKDSTMLNSIGSDAISTALKNTVRKLYKTELDDTALAVEITDMLKSLKEQIKTWLVSLPIKNINVTGSVKVGNVTFMNKDLGHVDNLTYALTYDNTEIGKQNKPINLKAVESVYFQADAWAVLEVSAHGSSIFNVARLHIERAINIIRAFTHVIFNSELPFGFGFPSDLSDGKTGCIARREKDHLVSYEMSGHFYPIELNEVVLNKLRSHCFFDVYCDLSTKPWKDLNKLEQVILVSLGWLGRSVIARTKAEAFTLCTIAIERLLISDGESTTVESFSDRLALLLGKKLETRKLINKSAKLLYNIRSKIVHSGFEDVEQRQLQEIESLALRALIHTTQRLTDLKDHRAFIDTLNDLKMA